MSSLAGEEIRSPCGCTLVMVATGSHVENGQRVVDLEAVVKYQCNRHHPPKARRSVWRRLADWCVPCKALRRG